MNFTPIPFTNDSGLTKFSGLAKFSSAGVIFEYESKFLGLFGSYVKEVRIERNEIAEIKFKRGMFKYGASITIVLNSLKKVSELPNKDGRIIINVKREDFNRAERAIEAISDKSVPDKAVESGEPKRVTVGELFEESSRDSKSKSKFGTSKFRKK